MTSGIGRSIFIDLGEASGPSEGGGAGVNRLCAGILRSAFPAASDAGAASLRVLSFSWDAPPLPRRLFIDHGSFADASFWAYGVPKLRTGDTILVASRVCVEVARRFIRSEGPRVLCVPFPVDIDLFRPATDRVAARRELETDLGVSREGPLLLVASGFIRRKNHHLAIRFLHALLDRVPGARLAFVGSAPPVGSGRSYRAEVEAIAHRSGLGERVDFLEHQPHSRLSLCMAAADLLVHFSNCRLENFGLVVAEAMASGLPVLAADWGGLRDLVVPDETGLLAPTYLTDRGPRTDWLSAVPAAAGILTDTNAWSRISRQARARAEREHGAGVYRDRLCAAVETALTGAADQRAVSLTEPAVDLTFRTITLNATHPEIASTGDEYRLLMTLDAGRHYRFLTGPAASIDRAPEVKLTDVLYPVATWSLEGSKVRVTDPAWPGEFSIDATQRSILESSDGSQILEGIVKKTGASGGSEVPVLRGAQVLVDQGVLCPLGSVPIRRGGS